MLKYRPLMQEKEACYFKEQHLLFKLRKKTNKESWLNNFSPLEMTVHNHEDNLKKLFVRIILICIILFTLIVNIN